MSGHGGRVRVLYLTHTLAIGGAEEMIRYLVAQLPLQVLPRFLLVLCEKDGVRGHAATLEPCATGRQMSIAAVV